ncbi:hypothetical protein DENSPDRAFT_883195 [Dentipellis sp. KUC8613]|nr:hypothetical protein DENSPDRAFT_883195 [Dentipellis sp. KUC8613]
MVLRALITLVNFPLSASSLSCSHHLYLHKFLVIAPSGTYRLITVLVHSAQRTQRPDIVAFQAHIRSCHVVNRTTNSHLFLDAHPQSPTYSRLPMKGEFPLVMVMVSAHTEARPPEGHEVARQDIYMAVDRNTVTVQHSTSYLISVPAAVSLRTRVQCSLSARAAPRLLRLIA